MKKPQVFSPGEFVTFKDAGKERVACVIRKCRESKLYQGYWLGVMPTTKGESSYVSLLRPYHKLKLRAFVAKRVPKSVNPCGGGEDFGQRTNP